MFLYRYILQLRKIIETMEGEVKPRGPSCYCSYQLAFNVRSHEEPACQVLHKGTREKLLIWIGLQILLLSLSPFKDNKTSSNRLKIFVSSFLNTPTYISQIASVSNSQTGLQSNMRKCFNCVKQISQHFVHTRGLTLC